MEEYYHTVGHEVFWIYLEEKYVGFVGCWVLGLVHLLYSGPAISETADDILFKDISSKVKFEMMPIF